MSIITSKNKKITKWAQEYALDRGCQAARVTFVAGTNNCFEYRDTKLDKLESSTESRLFVELFVDKKYGSFSSNRLEKKDLETFISEAISSTKHLSEDEFRTLPNPERYYKGDIDLGLFDNNYHSITTDTKLEIAKKAVEEIYKTHDDIISISASYDDSISEVYMISSNGFEHGNNKTSFSLVVSVSLKTNTDARSEGYWYDFSTHWYELQKEGIGKIALQKALEKVGQEKIATGKYDMLLDNMTSSRLLSPLIAAIFGGAIQQKNSFLIDKVGQKVFSEKLTIIDRPHQKRVLGARLYDGEGVATEERCVVKDGVLQTYFIDTYNSLKLKMTPTIASPSGLCIQLGDMNNEELIKTIEKGIWVTGFNGGNTNPTTGDFSFGIDGFLMEKGEVVKPVSEMNITGNLLTLWSNIIAIGNNPRHNTATKLPSVLFSDVSFSGL